MIVIGLLACLAIVWRIYTRRFTRPEWVLVALVSVNWIMIWAQINIADNVAIPEKRYWIQSFVLLCGWAVWGVDRVAAVSSRRFPFCRYALPVAIGLLVVFDFVMVVKPHIPFGRRYAYAQACAWAEDVIRRDWRGPEKDGKNPFSLREYHRPNRPIVQAFSRRLPYVLDGRRDNVAIFGSIDTPDYIVLDMRKTRERPGPDYERIGRKGFASREFELYRRRENRHGR